MFSTWVIKVVFFSYPYDFPANIVPDQMNIDLPVAPQPIHGKVQLFVDCAKESSPLMVMTQVVQPQLAPILSSLSGRYSPLRSMLFSLCDIVCF